jgi:hypothetical protein
MKLTTQQIDYLVSKVFESWKKHNIVTFKEDEKKVYSRAVDAVKAELQKEIDLEREVNKMLDGLEKTNPGEFQRGKMFQMLKQKLAKERKVIL